MIYVFLLGDYILMPRFFWLSFCVHPLTTWALNLENIQQLHVELILYIKAKMVPVMYVTEKFNVFYFSGNRVTWSKEMAHYFSFSVRWKVLNLKTRAAPEERSHGGSLGFSGPEDLARHQTFHLCAHKI